MQNALWFDTFYLQNFGFVALFLITLGLPIFFMRKKMVHAQASWASIKSWLYVLPFLFVTLGFPEPMPFIFMVLISIYSAKAFFQMTGMFHKSSFVYTTYLAIVASALLIHYELDALFFSMLFFFLFLLMLIPILQNKTENMIQYISLSFICFSLFGWSVLLGGYLFKINQGFYLLFYLYALSEFSTSTSNGMGLMIPSSSLFKNITVKARWTGLLASFAFTLLVAWAFRRLLFNREEVYWVSAGLTAFFGAHIGEWALSTFRKDLSIKDQGIFIIGRGDLLSRTNHIVFVYPFYTLFLWLLGDIKFF